MAAPSTTRLARKRRMPRVRPALLIALALSIALHILWSLWPADSLDAPPATVLTAELRAMPAPPSLSQPAPPPRPKPRVRTPRPAPAPEPLAEVVPETASAPAESASGVEDAPATPPSTLEDQLAATAPPPELPLQERAAPTLPARLDLSYKVYLGDQALLIGEAAYRFEHRGSEYHIETVGRARGLAALILRGEGKLESRGLVTATGLQPLEYAVERGGPDRREVARFDWESGVVTFHDDKTAALDNPSFDPLTVLWQTYFSPPIADEQAVTLATTRRVIRYTITREGVDRIAWKHGEVNAERWHRRSDDGQTDSYIWLAPELHYVAVKMRVSRTMRGTVEVILDGIRVDGPDAAHQQAASESSAAAPPP